MIKPQITYSPKEGYILSNGSNDAPMNDYSNMVVIGKKLTQEQRKLVKAAQRKLKD